MVENNNLVCLSSIFNRVMLASVQQHGHKYNKKGCVQDILEILEYFSICHQLINYETISILLKFIPNDNMSY